jgi:hypothetical protein
MTQTKNAARRTALATGLAALALLATMTVVGCAPTELVNVWRDPSIARPQLNKVLVIALRKDATHRRMWEDAFADELATYGVAATQSYRLCPQGAPDTTQMKECLMKDNFNGVLTITPLSPTMEQRYVPGYWANGPDYWFSPYWDRYYRWWWYYQQPGYVQTYSFTRNEIDVYMTHSGGETMVWSGTSDQTDPATMEEVRNSVADQVVKKLAKQGVIPGKI